MTFNDVAVRLVIDGREFDAVLNNMKNDIDDVGDKGQKAGGSLGSAFSAAKVGILATVAAIGAVVAGLNKAVNIASNYQEANSKMMTVFKGVGEEARKMRNELVNSYNMSYVEATKLISATGDLLTGMGMQSDKALALSSTTQKLAADLISFSNSEMGVEGASMAITKAMLGETESLKSLGVSIRQTDVEQRMLEKGQKNLTGEALMQAKAEATLELTMRQSKNAIGDLARTSDSYANTQRATAAAAENLALQLGSIFLPIWNKVMIAVRDFVNWLSANNISGILYATWTVISDFATRVYNLFTGLMGAIVSFANNDFISMGIYMSQITMAVAEGWTQTQEKIKASYVQGAVDFKTFMDGQVVDAENANNQIVEKTVEMTEKQLKAMQKLHEKVLDILNDKVKAENDLDEEYMEVAQERVDWQYELQNITTQQYMEALQQRLNIALAVYGIESEEYFKIQRQMVKVKTDADKAKKESEDNLIKSTSAGWAGMGRDLDTMNRYIFGKSKGLAYVSAIINTYEAASKAAAQTGIFAPFAIAAALAQGFAMVSMISAQKYARGGIVTGPTLGLVGEAGPEIIAPKKTFIDVQNELIRSGQVGGSNSRAVEGKLDKLISAIEGQKLSVAFDDDQLAIRVERGNAILQSRNY